MLVAFAADPALAKECRDAAGNVTRCPAPPAPTGDHCVSLRTSQRVKCRDPEAVPVVKGAVAGVPAKKPG